MPQAPGSGEGVQISAGGGAQGVRGLAGYGLALDTPSSNFFLSFVRTKRLRASTRRPRTPPKPPTALTSLRSSSRKVGAHLSELEGVGSWGPGSSPLCLGAWARAHCIPPVFLEARAQAGASGAPNHPLPRMAWSIEASRFERKASSAAHHMGSWAQVWSESIPVPKWSLAMALGLWTVTQLSWASVSSSVNWG